MNNIRQLLILLAAAFGVALPTTATTTEPVPASSVTVSGFQVSSIEFQVSAHFTDTAQATAAPSTAPPAVATTAAYDDTTGAFRAVFEFTLAPGKAPRPHRELVNDFKTNPQNWERTGTQAGKTPSGQYEGGLNIESQWRNTETGEQLSVHEAWKPDGTSIHPENASPNVPDGASIRPRNRAKELR